ncbi:hypothetical protein E2320_023006, partial [Naja naja]
MNVASAAKLSPAVLMSLATRELTQEHPFCCTHCGNCFTLSAHLQCHQGIHSGDKLFSCKGYGKGFTCYAHLEHHFAMHSGEKPFKCVSCGKGFGVASFTLEDTRKSIKFRRLGLCLLPSKQ